MKNKSVSEKLDCFIRKNKLQQIKELDSNCLHTDVKFRRKDNRKSATRLLELKNEKTSTLHTPECYPRASFTGNKISRNRKLIRLVSSCEELHVANALLKKRCSGDLQVLKTQVRKYTKTIR